MPDKRLVLVGAGGHCISVIDVVESAGTFEIAGLVDGPDQLGSQLLGYRVRWTDADLQSIAGDFAFCITVGQVESCEPRARLFDLVRLAHGTLPVLKAPTATVARRAHIADGTVLLHHASVNAMAEIGCNSIVNTGAVVEHGAVVGNHCHISTGAVVNGECLVGDGAMIGSNAVLHHGIRIGERAVVGAGAVVIRDVPAGVTVVGNPARVLR